MKLRDSWEVVFQPVSFVSEMGRSPERSDSCLLIHENVLTNEYISLPMNAASREEFARLEDLGLNLVGF